MDTVRLYERKGPVRMVYKRLSAFLLVCFLCLNSLAFVEDQKEITVKKNLLKTEYGTEFSWDVVTQTEESLARFAALCLRDLSAGMDPAVFRIEKVSDIYVYNLSNTPTLYLHTPVYDWNVYTIVTDTLSAYQNNPVSGDRVTAFIAYMEENAGWESPLRVDPARMAEYMTYEPETAASLLEKGGKESLFRHADNVYSFSCGWAAFRFQDFAGYISPTGEILDGGWNMVASFGDEGYAVVYRGETNTYGFAQSNEDGTYKGSWGIIDTEGNEVLPVEYDLVETPYDYPFVLVRNKEKQYQFFDLEKKAFFQPEDPEIVCTGHRCSDGFIAAFKGKLDEKMRVMGVNSEGKWGYINSEGKTVIPCIYESVGYVWYDGLATARIDGKTGVIDRKGNTVIPFTWDSISLDYERIIAKRDGKSFLLDRTGTILLSFNDDYVSATKYGFLLIYKDFNNDMGMMDQNGKEILPREYYSIRVLSDHLATVGKTGEDNAKTYGIIDYLTGEMVFPMVCEEIENESDGRSAFLQLGYYGYMDENRKTVISPQYLKQKSFSDGIAPVMTDSGEWIIIDRDGNRVY